MALKQSAIVLAPHWRKLIGTALLQRLSELDVYVLCAATREQHIHLLAKMPKGSSRYLLGKAKQHAWFAAATQAGKDAYGRNAAPQNSCVTSDTMPRYIAIFSITQNKASGPRGCNPWASLFL
jgi:hypothetical protein